MVLSTEKEKRSHSLGLATRRNDGLDFRHIVLKGCGVPKHQLPNISAFSPPGTWPGYTCPRPLKVGMAT